MNDKETSKDLKNKNRLTRTKAIFSVTREMLCRFEEIEKSTLHKYAASTDDQTGVDNRESIFGLASESISKIEENLSLTFIPENEETGNVCLANSPEVRDEYKETFAAKDLLDYVYAVLHSPEYRKQYQELPENDLPQISYPKDQYSFWKLVGLGAHLRQLHTSKSPDVEKYDKETETILKRIAEIEESR